MTETEFWNLIDAARAEHPDPHRHATRLTERLVSLGSEPTAAFVRQFDTVMAGLYRWDLWGAAYLAFGGCSDDGFEYFRAWIVGQGRTAVRIAADDPERFLVDLLGESDDPDTRWHGLGIDDGELLLYAGGLAYQELTASSTDRTIDLQLEPTGAEWDESDLTDLFPTLISALPEGWWNQDEAVDTPDGEPDRVLQTAIEGLTEAGSGDHARAVAVLAPLLDDAWDHLSRVGLAEDVAYAVGIGWLIAGDPAAARSALQKVTDPSEPVRRALAQVELSAGELSRAARLLEAGFDAHLFDKALSAVLSHRSGRDDSAVRLIDTVLAEATPETHHPWDAAGAALQVGLVSVELRDLERARRAVDVMTGLIEGAPDSLVQPYEILVAATLRLAGDRRAALSKLEPLSRMLSGSDAGSAWREIARCLLGDGNEASAAAMMDQAITAFETSGESWQATDARRELATWSRRQR